MHGWRVLLIPLLATAFAVTVTSPASAESVQKDSYVVAECNPSTPGGITVWTTGAVTHTNMTVHYRDFILVGSAWNEVGTSDVQIFSTESPLLTTVYHGSYEMSLEAVGDFTGSFAIGASGIGRAVGVSTDGTTLQKITLTWDPAGLTPPSNTYMCLYNYMTVMY